MRRFAGLGEGLCNALPLCMVTFLRQSSSTIYLQAGRDKRSTDLEDSPECD